MTTAFSKQLIRLRACDEARVWVGQKLPHEAWAACERPDWLLWLARALGVPPTTQVRAAAGCARLCLDRVPAGEDRPRLAVEAAEAWAADPTEANRVRCRDAAYAAARAAADAAYAAAIYADAADAAYAAYADAAYAADAYAYAASRVVGKAAVCDEIRRHIRVTATDESEMEIAT